MHVDPRGSCYVGNMQRRAPDFCQESFKVAGRTMGERVCCKLWKNWLVGARGSDVRLPGYRLFPVSPFLMNAL